MDGAAEQNMDLQTRIIVTVPAGVRREHSASGSQVESTRAWWRQLLGLECFSVFGRALQSLPATEVWFTCRAVMYSMYSQGHFAFVVFL